jgi:Heterokaryon incompatibility protein (HET)
MACVLLGRDYYPTNLDVSGEGALSKPLENEWRSEGHQVEKFEYEELLSEDHIRIIELLPSAKKDETIQCNLTLELRQDTENTYDAISYVWENPEDTVKIICCGKVLSITTSLADALRTLRYKNSGSVYRLWADAICIDQKNSEEKNHQVKRIGQVYQSARQVFAWIGHDQDNIALDCFDLIKKWCLYLDDQLSMYKRPQNIPSLEPPLEIYNDSTRRSKLKSFISCPWFSRVWVVQEAGLAKECHLLWGDQSMSIAELIEFACFCDGNTNITRLMGGDDLNIGFWKVVFNCIYRSYNTPDSWRCSKPLMQFFYEKYFDKPGLFLDVLQIGKSLSATDAHDHIYAFLGTPWACSNEGKMMLEPDYYRDEEDVYSDMTCALLRIRHESPYVLCFVQHNSADEVTGSNGPSWIPRWRKPKIGLMPFNTIGNIGLGQKAGGFADRLEYQVYSRTGDKQHLTIQGIIFDTLTETSEILKSENLAYDRERWDAELRTSQKAYIDVLWDSISSAPERSLTEPLEYAKYNDNFSFTIVTGYNNPLAVRPTEHQKRFKAYLQAIRHALDPTNVENALTSENQSRKASSYAMNTRRCSNRRLAVTEDGRFALVPQFAQMGDVCCVFLGMVTPFILRPTARQNDDRYYHLVGEAYIHGIMRGELVDKLDRGDIKSESITLV